MMRRISPSFLSALVLTPALLTAGTAQASFVFEDPANVATVDVNSNNATIDKTAGNISLSDFNDLASKYVFTLDTTRTGVTNDNLPASLTLTSAGSGTDLNAQVNASGGGYSVWVSGDGGTYVTSGDAYIATNRATVEVTITQGVKGVAFTLNRLVGDATVTLLNASNVAVGNAAGYTITGGASHGFFGFLGDASDDPIAKVVITTGGGNQFGLDDVAFTNSAVPEPASLGLLGGGLLLICRPRTNR